MLKQAALACCKLYVSESRSTKALDAIGNAAKAHPKCSLLNVFEDKNYNRVGYTLVSHLEQGTSLSSPLQETVLGMAKTALQYINLEEHTGTHPRLGVVDHICFHPLGEASLGQVASLASSVAAQIGTVLNGKLEHFLKDSGVIHIFLRKLLIICILASMISLWTVMKAILYGGWRICFIMSLGYAWAYFA